jgi:hypothetical protein
LISKGCAEVGTRRKPLFDHDFKHNREVLLVDKWRLPGHNLLQGKSVFRPMMTRVDVPVLSMGEKAQLLSAQYVYYICSELNTIPSAYMSASAVNLSFDPSKSSGASVCTYNCQY